MMAITAPNKTLGKGRLPVEDSIVQQKSAAEETPVIGSNIRSSCRFLLLSVGAFSLFCLN